MDPFEVSEGVGDQVEEEEFFEQSSTREERMAARQAKAEVEEEEIDSVRAAIIKKLPETWSKHEIDTFIATYYGKLPEETLNAEGEAETTTVVEEVDDTSLPVSNTSRKGYTLDTTVILDGRVVTLRSIYDAGQLVPTKVTVTEGSRRFPRRAIQYGARVVDRNLYFAITEETYKSLSKAYPQVVPHDEPLMAAGVKAVQSKVTVLTADNMERVLPKL